MKYLLILTSIMISFAANAEDCLDRADDRYAHEYYSNRYEANRERRRHSNDVCNDLFEMRKRLRQLEDELDEQHRAVRILKQQIDKGQR
jgi:hypothetical protein